jgi:putative oxidoreductase
MRLWPYGLGQGRWPVYQAYAVAFTELVGGACLLIGLMTRLWSVVLAGVMLGAIWLTEIGPSIQMGDAVLGFLPNRAALAPGEWQRLMLQLSLLMSSFALAFLGAGRASLDYMLFGPPRDEDDED